ncbi:tryptophan 2,3-dioxygenase family protein [Halobacteriovorax sp. HFRX-2_2]|uniref:tryptophan 2,3-dioxygenase family protein n=1 Tax=unclassified Halobacteriovorax TaxID=2639665 RepID=UPI00371F0CB8
MHKNHGPVYYGDYLELNKLLDTQNPLSKKYGDEAHDETLFIVVHQVYELWFKQILHELNSIKSIFSVDKVEESFLSTVCSRLERIKKVQTLLLGQLEVMETMTPMDFLEFRDLLVPASGFQSVQFREIEILLGLSTNQRKEVDREYFLGRLNEQDKERLLKIEKEPTLFSALEKWLERMPFTFNAEFDFWSEYQSCVEDMLCGDELTVLDNMATLPPKALEIQKANLQSTRDTFETLFNSDEYNKLVKEGKRRLSQKATLNALFVLLYRDEPILTLPYTVLAHLMDIDENFTTWRYKHALMAHRMLGTKIGTGGSSGHQYLKDAADNNRSFIDLFNLSTFIIPRSQRPVLPEKLKTAMNFNYRD